MTTEALHSERLLATTDARAELLLLHGWGSSRACWRPLLPALRPWANVTLVDLPGLGGAGPELDLESLLAALVAVAPRNAVLLGWSLGGQLAALLAARYPERVQALVTVASNPRFTATADWPGVPQRQLQLVGEGYRAAPERTLQRFEALQALQLPGSSALRQRLSASREAQPAAMARGLQWLSELDLRTALSTLEPPQLHLLGELDQLVPKALAPALAGLLGESPRRRVRVLEGAGHALPLQAPEWLGGQLHDFLQDTQRIALQDTRHLALEDTGLIAGGRPTGHRPGRQPQLAKSAIAGSFSRAAPSYDRVAGLQRDVGERLLGRLDGLRPKVATVLDLGCGTGHFQPALSRRYPGAHYIGLDLALGMLDYARHRRPQGDSWVAGDAEQLPLAADSVDLVFSSLAIQWCAHPEALFSELVRVLRPGGLCVFSTLGPATLGELRAAWAAVDGGVHVNEFLPEQALALASAQAGGGSWKLERECIRLFYQRVRDLVDELRTLGAHNVNSGRRAGLGGRRLLAGMMQAYEQFRDQGRLPATYEVYFGRLEKAPRP